MDDTEKYLLKFKNCYSACSATNINILETLEDFGIRDDNVFIVAYPKSELSEEDVGAVVEQATFQSMKSDPRVNYDYILKDVIKTQGNEGIFLHKGTIGDWKYRLTVKQNEKSYRIFQSKMKDFPLKCIWEITEE